MARIFLGDLPPGVTDLEAHVREHGHEQAEVEAMIAETTATVREAPRRRHTLDEGFAGRVYARHNGHPPPITAAARTPPPSPRSLEAIADRVYATPDDVAQAHVEQQPDDLSDLVEVIRPVEIYARYNASGQKKG